MSASSRSPSPFGPLVSDPGGSAILCDFDGTLAPIVDDPRTSAPQSGTTADLAVLASRLGLVAVVSGRPLEFLESFFDPSIQLAGLYGLETRFDGHRQVHPQSGTWREVIDDVAAASVARGPAGMRVESKRLSITLHFRGAPQIEHDVRAWAEQQGARSGLLVRPARMAYELHPPIHVDKGTTLVELAGHLRVVSFIGDDVGDLAAFDALDALAGRGVQVIRVAVRSAEESTELIARADVRLDGPPAVSELLAAICHDVLSSGA